MAMKTLFALWFALCLSAGAALPGPAWLAATAGASVSASNPLTNGIAVYWTLDENVFNGNRYDLYNGQTLTDADTAVAATTNCIHRRAIYINGNHKFTHDDSATLSLGADQPFTWSLWIWQDGSQSSYNVILNKGDFSGNGDEYTLNYDTSDKLRFLVGNGSANTEADLASALTDNAWHHICCWYDNVGQRLHIVADNSSTTSNSVAWTGKTQDTGSGFALGGNAANNNYRFKGYIDEVGFWKRVLTSAERTQLYAGGGGYQLQDYTNYTVVWQGSARFMRSGADSNLCDWFTPCSWPSNHYAVHHQVDTNGMYVYYAGDATYSCVTQVWCSNYVTKFIGPKTNVIFFSWTGENDIILDQTAGATIGNVFTNYLRTIYQLGAKVLAWELCYFLGMNSDETNSFNAFNTAATNMPWQLGGAFLNTSNIMMNPTNGYWGASGAEFTDDGNRHLATNLNNLMNTLIP